jgi:hypothetical protein
MPNALPTLDGISAYPPALAAAILSMGRFTLSLAVDFTKADGAVLFTVPGLVGNGRLAIERAFWEPKVSFAGGASSAIGLSSSNAAYNTKGDLLGGAGGDVAAGLTFAAPFFKGTIGAKAAGQGVIVLQTGDQILFNQIVSAFTSGSGFVHLPCSVIPPL